MTRKNLRLKREGRKSMTLQNRIEKAACDFITLNDAEADLYHGAGEAVAVVKNGEISSFDYLGNFDGNDEAKNLCQNLLDQQNAGADIYLGMCSGYTFCDPEKIDMGATGAAKLMRKIAEAPF